MNYARYAIIFVAVAVVAGLIVRLLGDHVGAGSATQLVVPAMIAALIEGQRFARATGARPDSGTAWRFTWIATGIATALNLSLAYLAAGFLPEFGKLAIAPAGGQQFLMLLGIYAGGYLICNRLFLGLGVSTELGRRRDG